MNKNTLMPLRRLHGRIHERRLEKKQVSFDKRLLKRGYALSKELYEKNHDSIEDYPVDFVVPWVDGSDPAWLADRAKYEVHDPIIQASNSIVRYRDWEIFQYWFRAVEEYAPWVRKVFLITWGHVPAWLNAASSKLQIVRHEEFIPHQYLPTFHVNPIELNMWRIPDLSEHFAYFNDDQILTRPVSKSDFFCHGLPKYCGLSKPNPPHESMTPFEHMLINNIGIFNFAFNIKECIIEHPEKWFSFQYGKDWDRNYVAYRDGYSAGFVFPHLGTPFRRSNMERFCELFSDKIDETCRGRFRHYNNINDQVFTLLEIYSGTFEPVGRSYYGEIRNLSLKNIDTIEKEILDKKCRMLCLNDWEGISDDDYTLLKQRLGSILQRAFPNKSSFEK